MTGGKIRKRREFRSLALGTKGGFGRDGLNQAHAKFKVIILLSGSWCGLGNKMHCYASLLRINIPFKSLIS